MGSAASHELEPYQKAELENLIALRKAELVEAGIRPTPERDPDDAIERRTEEAHIAEVELLNICPPLNEAVAESHVHVATESEGFQISEFNSNVLPISSNSAMQADSNRATAEGQDPFVSITASQRPNSIVRYSNDELLEAQNTWERASWAQMAEEIGPELLNSIQSQPSQSSQGGRTGPHPAHVSVPFPSGSQVLPAVQLVWHNREQDEGILLLDQATSTSYGEVVGNEEDFDSEEEETFQKPAFSVDGEPHFEEGPPEDGFEYLRRVRWERERCPKVKIAPINLRSYSNLQTSYLPAVPEIAPCPSHLAPSIDWERAFLADFSDLRLSLERLEAKGLPPCELELPPVSNGRALHIFCFGHPPPVVTSGPSQDADELALTGGAALRSGADCQGAEPREEDGAIIEEESETEQRECSEEGRKPKEQPGPADGIPVKSSRGAVEEEQIKPHQPHMGMLLRLDYLSRAALLQLHAAWLEGAAELSVERALWIHALAAVVGKPLSAATGASFRSVLRTCAAIRAQLASPKDPQLPLLNILIAIAGAYFGQSEARI